MHNMRRRNRTGLSRTVDTHTRNAGPLPTKVQYHLARRRSKAFALWLFAVFLDINNLSVRDE